MTATNLHTDWRGVTQYEVIAPLTVYAEMGTTESNTSVGSSQMLGNVYWTITLIAGDQITAHQYGAFTLVGEARRPIRFELSDKHPFEKVYLHHPEEWPLDRLRVINLPPVDCEKGERRSFAWADLQAAGAVIYGRGIDWVLPEGARL